MQASLLPWRHLTTTMLCSKTSTLVSFPLQIFKAIIPSILVTPQNKYGIQEANALYIDDTPYSLDELFKKYHIPAKHKFTCKRLTQFNAKYPKPTFPPDLGLLHRCPPHLGFLLTFSITHCRAKVPLAKPTPC